ncbi:MAG: response regulator [Ignavibacteriales bacterium]|nr:response regulator [Ignavibacteriales bacterium]
MQRIKTLVVDDEPLAREGISTLLQGAGDFQVIGHCANGEEAIEAIETKKPDVVFLDVQMPEIDGFQVLESLDPKRMPTVIFVTAYDQYALRAFDIHAVDYLLKPVDMERFEQALERTRKRLESKQTNGTDKHLKSLLEELKSRDRKLERLVVKTGGKIFFLRTEEIDWIEAAGDYVKIHINTTEHIIRERITELESKLDPSRFLRIHRSTIVNIDRIKEMQPMFYGDYVVILRNGTQLNLSRTYREKISKLMKSSL